MSGTLYKTSVEAGDTGETVPEIGPEASGTESTQETVTNGHAPMSYSIPAEAAGRSPDGGNDEADGGGETDTESYGFRPMGYDLEAGEEGGEESEFESVEGFDESVLTEAGGDEAGEEDATEATTDAWYGEATEAEQQEFFQFLAPLLVPALKSLLPVVASAAAKNLPGALSSILQRLGQSRRRRVRTEYGEEGSTDEAGALEAMSQQLEMIVDRDDRIRIQNTRVVPWRRICQLQITAANGKRFLGTGALIAPRTVVTAGHCVFMRQQGGWASAITVTPGRNGSSKPFGSCKAVGLRSVRGWVNTGSRDYDYGAIILPSSCRFGSPSAFGFASLADSELRARKLNTAGYAGDKQPGTLWFAGRKATNVTPTTLVYNTATMGGQSGSPVWFKRPTGQRVMVGIHTNGSMTGNSATRITAPVLQNMKRWRGEGMLMTADQMRPGIRVGTGQFQSA